MMQVKKKLFFSPETIQIDNRDGTTTLKVQEKSLYFRDIANELHNTYQQYSDVKIVCGDGARFDANKSILSRSKYLSEYLQMPEIQLQESKLNKISLESNRKIDIQFMKLGFRFYKK